MKLLLPVLCGVLLTRCHAKKNVVLIIVDDLRPALGCYQDRNAYTPNIDKLAQISIQFNNAYAQQALCAPSRNSMLISRRPDSLYLYDFYSYWRLAAGNFTTLPQYFRENGYTTASFGKVFHPGASSNWSDDSPYSWSVTPYHPPTQKFKDSAVCMDRSGRLNSNLVCPVNVDFQPESTLPDIQILQAAQQFLKNITQQSAFFMALGFHKPHIPLKFPEQYLAYHPLEKITRPVPEEWPPTTPTVAWNPWKDVRRRDDITSLNLTFPFGTIPISFAQYIRQGYYAAVTYIDDLIGKLIASLNEQKLMDNTIIVLVGDHGWSLGEHSEWAKYSNFDVAVRVPFLLYDPYLTAKRKLVSEHLVELVDVFPTLLELTGLPVPELCDRIPSAQQLCTEGESLVPIIQRQRKIKGKQAVFSQYPRPSVFPTHKTDEPKLADIKIMGYSIKTRRYRYTEWVGFQDLTPKWDQVHGVEMYDHHIDAKESVNLAGKLELENIQANLREKLRKGWRDARSI